MPNRPRPATELQSIARLAHEALDISEDQDHVRSILRLIIEHCESGDHAAEQMLLALKRAEKVGTTRHLARAVGRGGMSGERVTIEVCLDGLTGGYQLAIFAGNGGFRLAGPKFSGTSKTILTCVVDERAAREIRARLDPVFPDERLAEMEAIITRLYGTGV